MQEKVLGAEDLHPGYVPEAESPNHLWDFVSQPEPLTLPDFSRITPELVMDALARAITFQEQSIDAILENSEPADFNNTTLAIDAARSLVFRLQPFVRLYESSLWSDAVESMATDAAAVLTRAELDVFLNAELFARLESVSTAALNPEDARHHDLMVADFAHAGARLTEDNQERVAAFAEEISALETEFGQCVLAETQESAVHIPRGSELSLKGLSDAKLGTVESHAAQRGLTGALITLESTTQQPITSDLDDPETRTAVFHASTNRGARGTETDTRGVVSDLTALRAGLAGLMGYKSYKDYVISQQDAGNGEYATALVVDLLEPALAQLESELDTIRTTYQPQRLEAEDVAYYLNRYKQDTYQLGSVAEYFDLWKVFNDGVLFAASQLYGVRFERTDETAWHPEVVVYRAFDGDRPLGVICVDPFARSSKRGGAWMDQLVAPGRVSGLGPVISLTMNIPKPAAGEPALLSLDNVRTLFHEFGHVLHGLFANSTYETRSGTSVPRDYVEFPSQLNEMWALHPQVLPHYAVHVHTGEPIPDELVERIKKSQAFGQGFATVEYLAAALLDLSWHSLEPGEQVESVLDFESDVLSGTGFNPLVPPRYRTPYFQHTFALGYSAGYYSYLWSEKLAAYVTEWFNSKGGLNPDAGDAFRTAVLAPGYSTDPGETIVDFFGEQPGVGPLLRRRGLPDNQPEVADGSPEVDGDLVEGAD
ncbi:M3 family metallopeptidase [Brevibacterium paucivorans]